MKLDKALIGKLKSHMNKARKVGGKTLVDGKNLITKNPVESALFTLLAANIIKRTRSRKGTSLEQLNKS